MYGNKMIRIQRFVKTITAFLMSELLMRNEHQLQRLYFELISCANYRVNCVRNQVMLNWRLPLILHTDGSFVL
jgi:hypothetical protein